MANIMFVFGGLGFADLDPLSLEELVDWNRRAIALHNTVHGDGKKG